jgi:predicted dienelactone hydrolase
MRSLLSVVAFFGLAGLAPAQTDPPPSVPAVDAPALAPRGPYAVGVRTVELRHTAQIDILSFLPTTGKAPVYDRPLTVEIWYPAEAAAGAGDRIRYEMAFRTLPDEPPGPPKTFLIPGRALRDAPPIKERFPLVIVSHGHPGSRYFLSYLTENLASKGYVVAAIDHTDSVTGETKPFPSTLLNRAADQLFVLGALEGFSNEPGHFLAGRIDAARAAIVGYSMGGYGALASAGAGYSRKSLLMGLVPGGYLEDWAEGSPAYLARLRKEVKAVVAIAPWGAQPPYNAWEATALAAIHVPALFIAGDQDDVSDFQNGIRPAFERAVHSERCLLVYENARHNVGGNPPPPEALGSFVVREFFDEPVWRKDRITAINQHFITAFLDLTLKGDEAKRAFLYPSPEKSNDGQWPVKQGESTGARLSESGNYWKGFQRRWAVGLVMRCLAAAPE